MGTAGWLSAVVTQLAGQERALVKAALGNGPLSAARPIQHTMGLIGGSGWEIALGERRGRETGNQRAERGRVMSGLDYGAEAGRVLATVAARIPLIHHITNVVVTNDVANLTLAFGASPVMAYAPEEVAELAALAGALALNIGTLSASEIDAMLLAGRAAADRGVPIVLDPVGAGATAFRTASALRLLDALPITVLRGNRGEIGALVGSGQMRGVDAIGQEDQRAVASAAAERFGLTVAVTGAVDIIVGASGALEVHNGDPLLGRITGSGCMATAAIAIFLTTGGAPATQAALALATYGLAAERAAAGAPGPATFRTRLLDEVAALRGRGTSGVRIRATD